MAKIIIIIQQPDRMKKQQQQQQKEPHEEYPKIESNVWSFSSLLLLLLLLLVGGDGSWILFSHILLLLFQIAFLYSMNDYLYIAGIFGRWKIIDWYMNICVVISINRFGQTVFFSSNVFIWHCCCCCCYCSAFIESTTTASDRPIEWMKCLPI